MQPSATAERDARDDRSSLGSIREFPYSVLDPGQQAVHRLQTRDLDFAAQPANAVGRHELRRAIEQALGRDANQETTARTGFVDMPALRMARITDERIGRTRHDRLVNVPERPVVQPRLNQLTHGARRVRVVARVASDIAMEQANLKRLVADAPDPRAETAFDRPRRIADPMNPRDRPAVLFKLRSAPS